MKVLIKVGANGPPPHYQDGDIVVIVPDEHELSNTEKRGFLTIMCKGNDKNGKTSLVRGEDNKILAKRRWFIPYWDMFSGSLIEIRTPSIEFDTSDTIYSLNEIAVDKGVVGLLEDLE